MVTHHIMVDLDREPRARTTRPRIEAKRVVFTGGQRAGRPGARWGVLARSAAFGGQEPEEPEEREEPEGVVLA